MRLQDMRGCDKCGGKLFPIFHTIRSSLAAFDVNAVRRFHGMAMMGLPDAVALNMSGDSDDSVTVAMDKDKTMMTELLLCNACFCATDIAAIIQNRNDKKETP